MRRTDNKILFYWDLGELILCSIRFIVGLCVVPNAEVDPFDHSPEIFLGAILAALGCLVVSRRLANGNLVTAVAFLVCSLATIVVGFYAILGRRRSSQTSAAATHAH
jgi:hypothetical protein